MGLAAARFFKASRRRPRRAEPLNPPGMQRSSALHSQFAHHHGDQPRVLSPKRRHFHQRAAFRHKPAKFLSAMSSEPSNLVDLLKNFRDDTTTLVRDEISLGENRDKREDRQHLPQRGIPRCAGRLLRMPLSS